MSWEKLRYLLLQKAGQIIIQLYEHRTNFQNNKTRFLYIHGLMGFIFMS